MGVTIPDIEAERGRAEAALKAAERAMLERAHDPAAFQQAEQDLAAAQAEMRRIDFVEQHEAELRERAAIDKRKSDLAEAQERAHDAHKLAKDLAREIEPVVGQFEEVVIALKAAHAEIERGVHFEAYGVRDGLIVRGTIASGPLVDSEIGVRALRTARELVRLSASSPEAAELRARQRSL